MSEFDTGVDFADQILTCVSCTESFVFTADEQRFFHEKQFANIPRRCKKCKAARTGKGTNRAWMETRATCAECGLNATVPFKPTQGRAVLCRACFQKQRPAPAITER